MIKFFRKIRQKLLSENKFNKYLVYSIGEILLVVIGILIALQVNNWNQARLDKKQVKQYLISMTEDIKSDILEYDQNIRSYEKQIEYNSQILMNDDYQILEADSIINLLWGYWNLNRTSSQTYQKIKSTGQTETLGTPQIEKAINFYYNVSITHYDYLINWDLEMGQKDGDFWGYNEEFEINLPNQLKRTASLPFQDDASKRKASLIKLTESTLGRNHIRNAIARDEIGIGIVSGVKSKAEELLELIENEIKK